MGPADPQGGPPPDKQARTASPDRAGPPAASANGGADPHPHGQAGSQVRWAMPVHLLRLHSHGVSEPLDDGAALPPDLCLSCCCG